MNRSRYGSLTMELAGAVSGLVLLGILTVAAVGGVRQRAQLEAASARVEEAQNLLARWRRGGTITAPGWHLEQTATADGREILTLRADGVHLSTLRTRPTVAR
jgi:hypothetical protein